MDSLEHTKIPDVNVCFSKNA